MPAENGPTPPAAIVSGIAGRARPSSDIRADGSRPLLPYAPDLSRVKVRSRLPGPEVLVSCAARSEGPVAVLSLVGEGRRRRPSGETGGFQKHDYAKPRSDHRLQHSRGGSTRREPATLERGVKSLDDA
jgi:hypothetical protein